MKGISAVIATILMLMITIALAGMAWMYISGYLGGKMAKNVEIGSGSCIVNNPGNDNIFFPIKNTGTSPIKNSEITVFAPDGSKLNAIFDLDNDGNDDGDLNAGSSSILRIKHDCTDSGIKICTYSIVKPDGTTLQAPVSCSA